MPTDTELLNWLEKSWRSNGDCPVFFQEDETNDFERTFYGFMPCRTLIHLGEGVYINDNSKTQSNLSLREALALAMEKDTTNY